MASVVEIANAALTLMGQEPIVSLDEANANARALNQVWALTRDTVLASHPWNFATFRETLAADAEAPAFGFTRRYPLPSNPRWCLRIWPDRAFHGDAPWAVEGRFLLTDEGAPLYVRYIARVTDTEQWSPLAAEALAAALAERTAFKIEGSSGLAQDMAKLYRERLARARSVDGMESGEALAIEGSFLEARA